MPADVGTGTTIAFGTSSWSADLLSVSHSQSRESIDTTHMGTSTWRTFMPADLVDSGELTVEVAFDPNEPPPITAVSETITVTFPDASTWAASGFLTGFEYQNPLEDKMTASATVKLTGAITYA